MKKDIDKRGEILLEALPYIKKFWNKIVVIKYDKFTHFRRNGEWSERNWFERGRRPAFNCKKT
jgi:hypothetical protein